MINEYAIIFAGSIRVILLVNYIIFIYLLSLHYKHHRLKVSLLLVLGNAISLLVTSIQILSLIISDESSFSNTGALDATMGVISAILMLIFLDLYSESHLNALRLSFASVIGMMTIIGVSSYFNFTNEILNDFFGSVYLIFFGYIVYFAHNAINKMKRFATAEHQILMGHLLKYFYLSYVGVSFVYLSIGLIGISLGVDSFEEAPLWAQLYITSMPQILFILGNIYFYRGYIRYRNPSVIQPQRIDRFVIISDDGLPIYRLDIEKEATGLTDALFSGALTAITSVLKESSNIVGDLKTIEIGDQFLIVNVKGPLTGVLFSFRTTQFLREATVELMKNIAKNIQIEELHKISTEQLSEIDYYVKQALGLKI